MVQKLKELKALGLTKWIYKQVVSYHITASKFLQKYFKTTLKDLAMTNMTALDPKKQSHVLISGKLRSLASQYSILYLRRELDYLH